MPDMQITNEVNQHFLRRTPVKLRQFSRLLTDMLTQKIEPLRVKALLSQVNKTREACIAQGFDSTAKLLNQVLKQLSLSEDTLETQRPLLKRLSQKLHEHSEKLVLGVRPQKQAPPPQPEHKSQAEVCDESIDAKPGIGESDREMARLETTVPDEHIDDDDSIDSSLAEEGIYLDKGVVIFVSQLGERYQTISRQFESLGVEVKHVDNMVEAKRYAIDNPGSIIVAPLKFAKNNEQLEDDDIETNRIPLIYTAKEDNQADRLLALRSGGTGYLIEPVSISGLFELIERQYDIHANSPYRVLVMEDSKAQAKFYEKVLSKGHFDVRLVNDPSLIMEALRGFDPETILMDMQMPGCSGIELTRIIRQMPRYAYLPIIFLSAEENIRKQNQALLSGGNAFVVKPAKKEQVMFLADLYCKRFRGLNPQIDINPDTGLVFCPQFKQQISIEASRLTRSGGIAALVICQLDETDTLISGANYSLINVAIQQLALLLKKRLRKTDIIGHLETGQLGIILTTGNKNDWLRVMDEVRLQFAELPFHFQHQDKPLSVSIGLSILATNSDAHSWFEQSVQNLIKALGEGDCIHSGTHLS